MASGTRWRVRSSATTANAGDARRLAEERGDGGGVEVVEEEGRGDDVDGAVGEREAKGVGGDAPAPRREARVEELPVEVDRDELPPAAGELARERAAHVPAPGAEVEEDRARRGDGEEERDEVAPHDRPAAERAVDPLDVGEALLGRVRRARSPSRISSEGTRGGTRRLTEGQLPRARPVLTTRAVFFEPKAIPFTSATSTSAGRAARGT